MNEIHSDLNSSAQTTETGPAVQVCGASFWIRAVAHGIDLLILTMLSCVICIPFVIIALKQGPMVDPASVTFPGWLAITLDLALAVGLIILWHKTQTTPGKAIFQLKIVDSNTGELPSWGKLVARFFGYIIASVPVPLRLFALSNPALAENPIYGHLFSTWMFPLPLMLGFFWILIDSRNRGWHDLLSGTVPISSGAAQTRIAR